MRTEIKGVLEIDHDRGVLYFHAEDKAIMRKYGSVSVLRICGLPRPIPERALDVTLREDRVVGTRTWYVGISSGMEE